MLHNISLVPKFVVEFIDTRNASFSIGSATVVWAFPEYNSKNDPKNTINLNKFTLIGKRIMDSLFEQEKGILTVNSVIVPLLYTHRSNSENLRGSISNYPKYNSSLTTPAG